MRRRNLLLFLPSFSYAFFEVTPMGMRIRKKWDLPSEQGRTLVVLSISFLIGGLAGCILAALSGGAGVEELSCYLVDYLTLTQSGQLSRSLWLVLWGQVKYLMAALLFSFTALGLAGFPVLLCTRGFFLSFPVACFCRVFGNRGLFPAFFLFGLPALLWAPALFLLGASGFLSAQQLLRRAMGEGRGVLPLNGAYLCRAGLCVGLALAAGLLEYWVVPVLLRETARMIL